MKTSILLAFAGAATLAFAQVKGDIEVPYIPFQIKMGKHFDAVQANCLTCHSFGYILNQDKQSRTFWEEKVHKMVHAFKAPIAPKDQQYIAQYLFEHYGNGKEK